MLNYFSMDFLDTMEEEDNSSICSSDSLPIKVDVEIHCQNSDDADDEHSQNSTPPDVTPDLKTAIFKCPSTVPSQPSQTVSQSTGSDTTNDDGFFSGFDVDECLTEDMEIV